ncbi:MAG: YggS family pyridoxal phosphate-dependent enzyme [Akkermansiaceae bacterium]|nr:YggS family pyridoxal phosphate-dependent enzyme [Akkermansiaceae bacterium]
MSQIEKNLSAVKQEILAACSRVGRDPATVDLIAVSKTFPVALIHDAVDAGHRHFGESKLQEAEPKINTLPNSIHWHFIGGVQRNKVRKLLQNFEIIHAIDSLKLAAYVDQIATELGLFPKIFLQVNIGRETTKGGFLEEILRTEMENILSLKRLEILGLMCIPPAGPDPESARKWFASLREMRGALEEEFCVKLPALSMGMSGDFQIAIEEGSTHVRVGSAIFGKRAYRVDGELG